MNIRNIKSNHCSEMKKIATSGPFQIELMKYVGTNDYDALIEISKSLIPEYGKPALLTPNTIQTYFNRKGSLPFIARYQGEIIGYIIGIPIEILNKLVENIYSKIGINNLKEFKNYLNSNQIDYRKVLNKIEIEALWNELIFLKYSDKIKIDKNKLLEEVKKNINRENKSYLMSEIIFEISQSETTKNNQ